MRQRFRAAACRCKWVVSVVLTALIFSAVIQLTPRLPGAADPNSLMVQGPNMWGNPLPTAWLAPLSGGLQVPVMASARGTNASITATLPAAVGKTTFITGMAIHVGFATAGIELDCQITGIPTTLDFDIRVPTGVTGAPAYWQTTYFTPALPGSAVNTAILVTVPAAGVGDSGTSVCAWGYQQ